jgi:GNAT superfamily N-acetyltransferase
MATRNFCVRPARYDDIPVLAAISEDAFECDSQTEMKSHGQTPFSMREYSLTSLPSYIDHPTIRTIQAVEEGTGAVMGFCIWGFRGVDPPAFPKDQLGVRPQPTAEPRPAARDDPPKDTADGAPATRTDPDDPVARLVKLTDADLEHWSKTVMPSGTACLFVIGLSVSPAFQRRGVGSALLKWGTDLADAGSTFAWVHSSAGAWRAYAKAGFKTIRTLDVDLDEYAPVPAPADRFEGGKWGHYVFRYMVYGTLPKELRLQAANPTKPLEIAEQ